MKKRIMIITIFLMSFLFTECHHDFFLSFSPNNVLKNLNFSWVIDSSKHVNYYYPPNSLAANDIEEIKDITEKGISRILMLMHEEDYHQRIQYFIVESRKKMKGLINAETNGAANWKYNGVYYVYGDSIKSGGPHEFNHVIASNMWGIGKVDRLVSEGFADYADNKWHKYDLHSLCKYLLEEQKLIPIEKLDTHFSEYNDLVTYPESASFVKFLYEKYGWYKFKQLWQEGSENITSIFGKSLGELEKEWIEEIKKSNSSNIDYKL